MTAASDGKLDRSPWLSVWFRPGDTIGRVLARKAPHLNLLPLAAGGVAYPLTLTLFREGLTTALLDWRLVIALVVVTIIMSIVSLYLNAFFLSWSGRIFGGHTSPAQMRVIFAWSMAPFWVALAISLVIVVGLGGADKPASAVVGGVLNIIGLIVMVWVIVATLIMLRRVQAFGWWRAIFNYAAGTALAVLLIGVPIRTFLFQSFNMPSGSMKPTLVVGDYFFVSKYAYGYSHFSLPSSPALFPGRIFPTEPRRGDVVVFRNPKGPATDYVKRIVGLPGDRIQMKDGLLYINMTPVRRERVEDFVDGESPAATRIRRWRETLPNGVSYETLDLQENGFLDNTQEFAVPADHYFTMGDNRDNSTDSRVLSQVGYVPFENLVGRAEIIYFSIQRAKQPAMRFERLGLPIQ
jgi:signal peptidase I